MRDPIKTLVSRYASLPYFLRLEVAKRLLTWRDEGQGLNNNGTKSFVEQFWDEVEKTHNDGLYPRNPFRKDKMRFSY
jgi:hypothetical protein